MTRKDSDVMAARVAYSIFEQTVIGLYNRGELTVDLLDTLAGMYRGMRVDSAGSKGLVANDSKDLPQVCIALVNPSFALIERGSQEDDHEYWEKELKEWSAIIASRWCWCGRRVPGSRSHI